ncbi:MAG: phosphoglycerate mutase [Thermoprotei archaeon]|nr:MAG: phosphoglycerate mutase [Thermoprotei archaeon]
MKKLLYVILDGAGDRPNPQLGGKTPLQYADKPVIDELAKAGVTGLVYTVGEGIAPESDVAVLSILGYDPFKHHVGRGVLEALGANLEFRDGWLALRCNFATIDENLRILDRRCGRTLTTAEAHKLAEAVNSQVKLEEAEFTFRSTIGHRGVLVVRSLRGYLSSNITNTDPAYEKVGLMGVAKAPSEMKVSECKPLDDKPESALAAKLVNDFTLKAIQVLDKHPVNEERRRKGLLPANAILCRDASDSLPKLKPIEELYGLRMACLAEMPVERGIAVAAGMEVVPIPPMTGNPQVDYKLRAESALEALVKYDGVYVHLKGPDEPGHDGDPLRKAKSIEDIDKYFFSIVVEELDTSEVVLAVTADHSTPCTLKAHSDDPVPILVVGGGVEPDDVEAFDEDSCRRGALGVMRGVEIMPKLVEYLRLE